MRNISKKKALFGVGTVGIISLVASSAIAPGAVAAGTTDPGVSVSNTETVQVLMDANAGVDSQRVYEQLVLKGKGKVDIANPVSTTNLRNLDGFGSYDVRDGKVRVKTDVDGAKKYRSVSSFTKKLPLKISVAYFLDGKKVKASDVVGKSGDLEVKYRVKNVTGEDQDVEYQDGEGNTQSESEKVVIPMVGSMTTTLPSNFTKVKSAEANAAGDGRGGTQLSFTMTLFPPIGKSYADFGYTAHINGGEIPKASLSALPVNPLESPSFKGGAESYKGGAETGQDLTAGATEIDSNLLKLRDGANELISGILQLQDGAGQLSSGLNNDAVPGAKKLANGAGELNAGAGELNAGAGDLSAGANKLNSGAGDLSAGIDKAAGGSKALPGGLGQLSDGAKKLSSNLGSITKGVGKKSDIANPDDPKSAKNTLLGGVNALKFGIELPVIDAKGTPGVKAALQKLIDGVDGTTKQLGCAVQVLDDITSDDDAVKVDPACIEGAGLPPGSENLIHAQPKETNGAYSLALTVLKNQINTNLTDVDTGVPALRGGLVELKNKLGGDFVNGLVSIGCGLDNTYSATCSLGKPGIVQGVGTGAKGEYDKDGTPLTLKAGANALSKGATKAQDGAKDLVSGLGQLSAGGNKLAAGTGTLANGAGQLNSGAGALSAGAGQLSAGAGTLADGLGTAADGASQLSAGLDKAAEAAPAIPEGAEKLSKEGTQKLIEAGNETASDYGLKYAVIEAGAQRAGSAQPYGSPEGAKELTAYKFELAGATGESSSNAKRGIAAVVLLAAVAGVAALRRRMV